MLPASDAASQEASRDPEAPPTTGTVDVQVAVDSAHEQQALRPPVEGAPIGMPAVLQPFNVDREERRERRRRKKQERMSDKQRRYGLVLGVASALDVIISGFMVCVAFAHAYLDNGVSLYCLAIQAISHTLSSILLAHRFLDEWMLPDDAPAGPEEGLLKMRRRGYLQREKCMSFFMGIAMMISSIALLVKAFRKWMFWDTWYLDHNDVDHDALFATIFLAWYGVVIYSFHAILRGTIGKVLKRRVVTDSTLASLVSLCYLFVLGIGATIEKEWSWKAEPIIAIALACATIAEGSRLIYTHRGEVDLRLDLDPMA